MAELRWGEIDSLLDLAVVLNAAYFTFRHANHPILDRLEHRIKDLESAREHYRSEIGGNISGQISIVASSFRTFKTDNYFLYYSSDPIFLCYGYAVCIIYSILLFYSSIFSDESISYATVSVIFILGYSAVMIALASEIVIYVKTAAILRRSDDLYKILEQQAQ